MNDIPARCGSISGANRHRNNGEPVCPVCRQTERDQKRARYLRKKSGYRLTVAEALQKLGLPTDRIPAHGP